MSADDDALLQAWRAGDDAAGSALFRRYFARCRRFFMSKVPAGDVEDLVQQTFAAAVEGRDRFRGDAQFACFLFGIARRKLMRHLRDHARRGSKHTPDFHDRSLAELGVVTAASAIALERDQETVRSALTKIPVKYQTIIELKYWEGLSSAELAEILEIEPATVRTRLHRARKALAQALEGTGLAEDRAVEAAIQRLGASL